MVHDNDAAGLETGCVEREQGLIVKGSGPAADLDFETLTWGKNLDSWNARSLVSD